MKKILLIFILIVSFNELFAQDIQLTVPSKTGGKPLMEVLNERKSTREFVQQEIPINMLSDLFWAAYGFNREAKRTVASSQNRQEIDVYAVFPNGIYMYDANANVLKQCYVGDFTEALGQPNISQNASFTLVYVANLDKASNKEAGYIDSGFIAQNVYLYCASVGLGTVVRASFKRPDLHDALKLNENQHITIVQPVGVVK